MMSQRRQAEGLPVPCRGSIAIHISRVLHAAVPSNTYPALGSMSSAAAVHLSLRGPELADVCGQQIRTSHRPRSLRSRAQCRHDQAKQRYHLSTNLHPRIPPGRTAVLRSFSEFKGVRKAATLRTRTTVRRLSAPSALLNTPVTKKAVPP